MTNHISHEGPRKNRRGRMILLAAILLVAGALCAWWLADTSGAAVLCSSDAVVFRYLGWTQMPDRGISLEEVAQSLGVSGGLKMQWKLTHAFREKYTRQGFAEAMQAGAILP